MTTTSARQTGSRSNLALATLALGAFVIGTAELIVVGLLDLIAEDMGVSVSSAGLIVTSYALGISIGGPVLGGLTTRVSRRSLLVLSIATYVAGNVVAVLTTEFGLLIVARVLTGSLHGLFLGVASVVAAGLVPAARQGQAISMVFGGISVATVLGVPLGTTIGQAFGWRTSFLGIIVLGSVALAATLFAVPPVEHPRNAGVGAQMRTAFAPRVLAVLLVGLLLNGGAFTVFTYLAPYLQEITGVSPDFVSLYLLAFGIASAVGIVIGGKAADRYPAQTLIVANVALVLIIGALLLFGSSPVLALILLAAWGFTLFGLIPSFQLRAITLAGPGGDLAATLGASSVNAGIAGGAVVGGWALATWDVNSVAVAGLVILVVAIPVTVASSMLRWTPAANDDEPADVAKAAEVPLTTD